MSVDSIPFFATMVVVVAALMLYRHRDSTKTRDLIYQTSKETRDLIYQTSKETRDLIKENRELTDRNRDLIEECHLETAASIGRSGSA